MSKIAIIETKPSSIDYAYEFKGAFAFDQFRMCSDPTIKKPLKRDMDIDVNVDDYDWVILVGADASKYYAKVSVTDHTGKKVNGKFLPVISPLMLKFKPELKRVWESSRDSIISYIRGEIEDVVIDDSIARGINDTAEANAFLQAAIDYPLEHIALDSETSGLYPRDGHMLGISICYDMKHGAYISTDCFDETTEELLKQLCKSKTVIFHNAKFDMAFFEYYFGCDFPSFEDTMLLHYLIDENPGGHGLKQLAIKFTPYGDYEKPMYDWMEQYRKQHGILKDDFRWEWIPFDEMKTYAAMDALVTFLLFNKLKRIKDNKKLCWVYDNILIPGCRFLKEVQDNGVPFDKSRLLKAQNLMQHDIDASIRELYEDERIVEFERIQGKEFNPNSTVQLRSLLFNHLGLTPVEGKVTGTGAISTDAEVLKELADKSEVPALILNIRQKAKIKNTYLDKIIPQLDTDSRLRTNYNLHGTTSGRLSSSGKLNMQQLPRDNPIVKGCIRAQEGNKIVAMDLRTAEMYIAAVLSGDRNLQNVFKNGGDFHSSIAKQVFNLPCPVEEVKELFPIERQASKAVSFGILYGAGAHKISSEITKSSGKNYSIDMAQEVINDYFSAFKQLKRWIDDNKKSIEANGFIYSSFGRKRRLPNVESENKGIKGNSIRSGLNFLVQSVASDINLLGAIDMQSDIKTSGMKARIFALVHDSVLAEVPNEEVDVYMQKLQHHIQLDRGVSIPNCPIGCDFEVGEDYSMGKYEKYVNEAGTIA